MNKEPAHKTASYRIPCYDMARALGIMLVVFGHALQPDTYPRAIIYSFHIPLFFFISGAVMKPIKMGGDIRKRLYLACFAERKLFITYIFYSICFILFDIVIRIFTLRQMKPIDIFGDIYQTISCYGINVLWFIITLALTKVLVRLSYINNLYYFITTIIWFLIFASLGNIYTTYLSQSIHHFISYFINAFFLTNTMFPFVALGYYLRSIIPNAIQEWSFALPFLLLINIVLCFQFGCIDYHMLHTAFPPLSFLLAITGILGTLGIGDILSKIPLINSTLKWYSNNSLLIMVTHEYPLIKPLIVVPILNILCPEFADYTLIQVIALLFFEIPLCLLLAPITNRCINYFTKRIDKKYTTQHQLEILK